MWGCRDRGIQGYGDTGSVGIHGYGDTRIWGYTDMGIQGYRHTGLPCYSGALEDTRGYEGTVRSAGQ